MRLLKLFASTAHITYNKYIAKKFGVDEAILFGELCSKYEQFTDGEIGTEKDEFYCTMENLIEDTCLTEYRIRNAMKNLVADNMLEITKKGIPAKNYYKLNEDRILEICDIQRTSDSKFDTTRDSKFKITTTIKNDATRDSKSNTTFIKKEKEESNNKKRKTKKEKFLDSISSKLQEYDFKPTVEEKILDFFEMWADNNYKPPVQSVEAQLNLLATMSLNEQLNSIDTSIRQGWKSLAYENSNKSRRGFVDTAPQDLKWNKEQRELHKNEKGMSF